MRKVKLFQSSDVSLINNLLEKWLIEKEGEIKDIDYSVVTQELSGMTYGSTGQKLPSTCMTTLMVRYYDK